MGKRYLLDTNTVLDYMGNKLPDKAKTALAHIIDDEPSHDNNINPQKNDILHGEFHVTRKNK